MEKQEEAPAVGVTHPAAEVVIEAARLTAVKGPGQRRSHGISASDNLQTVATVRERIRPYAKAEDYGAQSYVTNKAGQ